MPTAYVEGLEQQATYWAPDAPDGQGNVTFASPVLIACRWQGITQLVSVAPGQSQPKSGTVVYVDRATKPKGYLALGDRLTTANPKTLPSHGDSGQILHALATPSLDGDEVLYGAVL